MHLAECTSLPSLERRQKMGGEGRKQVFLRKTLQIFRNSLLPLPTEYRHWRSVVQDDDFRDLRECPFLQR